MLNRSPPSPSNIALATIQSFTLVFAIWIRSSAVWVVLGLAILATLVSIQALLNRRFKLVQVWSFGSLVIVLALHTVWVSAMLHPIYRDKGEISHHVFWHAVFLRLQFHPLWEQKYSSAYDHARFDELPRVAALKYLLRHPPPDPDSVYLTPDRKHLKVAAAETYVRKAFFEFLAADPKFALESTFLYNPLAVATNLEAYLRSLDQTTAFQCIAVASVLLVLAGFLAVQGANLWLFGSGVLVVTGGFLISLLPILLTVAYGQAMGDQFMLLLIALGGWTVLALSTGMRACLPRRSPHPSPGSHAPGS